MLTPSKHLNDLLETTNKQEEKQLQNLTTQSEKLLVKYKTKPRETNAIQHRN